jgi:hypothetical protein
MDAQQRRTEAREYHATALNRVRTTPPPAGQKFSPGTRVRISGLPRHMSHFPSGAGTVRYTYAHAFGHGATDSYCVFIDGVGEVAWYPESVLELVAEGAGD